VVKMLLEYVENTGADFDGLQSVRNIILSGDVVPHSLVVDILKDIPFVNLYISGGPTEICVWSNFYLYEDGKSKLSYVPYGCSIANKTMYIMKDGKLVDMEEGEIVSGGAGLAIDYIKDSERTNKQFKNNKKLGRLYFTGDRGILTKEGIIQICGRMDNQVKINGFRVELEEIECILNGMDEISQSISCVKKEIEGDDKLVAGIMLNQGKSIEVSEIKSRLRQHVPEYAIPSEFIFLEKLPLSANNKVDRKSFTAMVTKEVV
ncbi:MAG: AMP-binding protein, partial [Pseudobutyrivibrio sp.]|nr:AMP-binding protein [Pseudobutyrivibrio sp.]